MNLPEKIEPEKFYDAGHPTIKELGPEARKINEILDYLKEIQDKR